MQESCQMQLCIMMLPTGSIDNDVDDFIGFQHRGLQPPNKLSFPTQTLQMLRPFCF